MEDSDGHSVTMEVIGAGYGRTGTASLKAALEILGFGPCYHMFEIQRAPWKARDWLPSTRGEALDWARVYRGYRSAVDWPTCNFYAELAEAYPDARFVLTTRDPDSWYESARTTLYAFWCSLPAWSAVLPLFGAVRALLRSSIWDGVFEGRFDDKAHALACLQEHERAVLQTLPPERLLRFRVDEGWPPLCAFLGVDVPDQPFPRLNPAREIVSLVRWFRLGLGALYVGLVLLGSYVAFRVLG
ncbi:MAG: sulfotransferase [Myxococcota bacterium]|nr:sulfotransferase [Myxococcota bacterium]